MSRPQHTFWTLSRPQKYPISALKSKNDPKVKSKSKVRIEGTIENKSCSTTWVDPKTVFEPYPDPKKTFGAQKCKKMTPKLSQNQKLELKEL